MPSLLPFLLFFFPVLISGCAHLSDHSNVKSSSIYLLGEVHDNPDGHQARLEYLKEISGLRDKRVVLVMEQFDRGNQQALNDALESCTDAACVASKAGTKGWDWSLYLALIDLAMQNKWRIFAGNLSREEVTLAMKTGINSVLDKSLINQFEPRASNPPELYLQTQADSIVLGHCNLIGRSQALKMTSGQMARDLWMAHQIKSNLNSNTIVVLIAGNGHVRNDVGVPFWLESAGLIQHQSVGFIETESLTRETNGDFDLQIAIAPHKRTDPCLELKRHISKPN